MKPSVLLTGGLGYVGGRVALALVHAGYEVRCGSRRSGIAAPTWLPTLSMAHLDWDSTDSLAQACHGVEFVIHLAAANEIESVRDPVAALRINGLASLRLLEAAKRSNVRRFIYFSTAHVYGSPLQGEITEASLPRPIHPYAITHKVAEDFVLAAHDQTQIEGIVVRLSNGFGAPATPDIDRWTLLVNDLCRQAAVNGELKLNSAGTQQRDFITLGDVAAAVVHLMQLDASRIGNGLFNLGSGNSVSILEMTDRVAARWRTLTHSEIAIVRPSDDCSPAQPLIYRSDKLVETGYTPTNQIDLEIDNTLRLCLDAFQK